GGSLRCPPPVGLPPGSSPRATAPSATSPTSPSWASASCTSAMPAPSDGTPLRFDRTSTPGELAAKHGSLEPGASTGEVHRVAGRIQTTLGHGKLAFADLGDCVGKNQLSAPASHLGDRFQDFLSPGVVPCAGAG